MNMYDIIYKKRQSGELTKGEIEFFIREYTDGSIPDYQASALLMAIAINGMTDNETALLTKAMAESGDSVDLSDLGKLSVDKHSTGGVGDKTTLIVAPIVAACGGKLAKMSGRGLGHTGGTVDKLESVSGYKTTLSPKEFLEQSQNIGVAVIGQSGNLAPADKKLYALRDVTATVDSIPLIVSSIMSKKMAAGSKSIVLDVKTGNGAFMKDLSSATILAEKMVEIGKSCGRNMAAVISDMNKPLGKAVGNNLEVIEAISVLKGETEGDLRELCITLSANMLSLCLEIPIDDATNQAEQALDSGRAYEKFKEWISVQGGDIRLIENPELFEKSRYKKEIKAQKSGYILSVNTLLVGKAAGILGAGREKKEEKIDFTAGITVEKNVGDKVEEGETLAVLYTGNEESLYAAEEMYLSAVSLSKLPPEKPTLIYKIVR